MTDHEPSKREVNRLADQLRHDYGEATGRPVVTPWHDLTDTAREAWRRAARKKLAPPSEPQEPESRFVHQGPVEEHDGAHVHPGVVVVTGPVDEVACPLCRPPDLSLLDAFAARVPSEPQES